MGLMRLLAQTLKSLIWKRIIVIQYLEQKLRGIQLLFKAREITRRQRFQNDERSRLSIKNPEAAVKQAEIRENARSFHEVLARCLGLCKPALSLTLQNWKGGDPVETTLKLPKTWQQRFPRLARWRFWKGVAVMQHSSMRTCLGANLLAAKQEIQHLNHDRNRARALKESRGYRTKHKPHARDWDVQVSFQTAPTNSEAIEYFFSLIEDEQGGEVQDYGSTIQAIACHRIHCLLEMGKRRMRVGWRSQYAKFQKDTWPGEQSYGPTRI